MYWIVNKKIMENVGKERDYSRAENLLNLAFTLWNIYEKTQRGDKQRGDKKYMLLELEATIRRAEAALKLTEGFDEDHKRKYEKFICCCKNDLACYLAEKGDSKDKETIKALIEDIIGKKTKYPSYASTWTHTCVFIKRRFPDIKISCGC